MASDKIVRFSVSIEESLLKSFEQYCQKEQFATRSEAVRQLIRDRLTSWNWEKGKAEVAGTLTLVYDHHRPQLLDKLTKIQHDHNALIISTTHIHLSHDLCLEVIFLRGPANQVQVVASKLKGLKGIHRGELVVARVEGSH